MPRACGLIRRIRPLASFAIRDRLGQTIFAWDSTREPGLLGLTLPAGRRVRSSFTFSFPYLLGGRYTLNLAIADGTQHQFSQLHWMFDAMTFDVTWSTVMQGLIGVPIKVACEPAD